MAILIDHPPAPTGNADHDIRRMYSYLYQTIENLNAALDSIQQTLTKLQNAGKEGK